MAEKNAHLPSWWTTAIEPPWAAQKDTSKWVNFFLQFLG